jgi:hypothetical protein
VAVSKPPALLPFHMLPNAGTQEVTVPGNAGPLWTDYYLPTPTLFEHFQSTHSQLLDSEFHFRIIPAVYTSQYLQYLRAAVISPIYLFSVLDNPCAFGYCLHGLFSPLPWLPSPNSCSPVIPSKCALSYRLYSTHTLSSTGPGQNINS